MKTYILQESDYDYSETHTIAFSSLEEAEKYKKQIQAKLDAAHHEQLEFVRLEMPDMYEHFPKSHPHDLEIIELEVVDKCPE